jgi:hypothetical protein
MMPKPPQPSLSPVEFFKMNPDFDTSQTSQWRYGIIRPEILDKKKKKALKTWYSSTHYRGNFFIMRPGNVIDACWSYNHVDQRSPESYMRYALEMLLEGVELSKTDPSKDNPDQIDRSIFLYVSFPTTGMEYEEYYLAKVLTSQLAAQEDPKHMFLSADPEFTYYELFTQLIDRLPSTTEVIILIDLIAFYNKEDETKHLFGHLWDILVQGYRAKTCIKELTKYITIPSLEITSKINKKRSEKINEEIIRLEEQAVQVMEGPVLRVMFTGPGTDKVYQLCREAVEEDIYVV